MQLYHAKDEEAYYILIWNNLSRSSEKSKVQSSIYDLISFGLKKKKMSIFLCKHVISLEGKKVITLPLWKGRAILRKSFIFVLLEF